jgi:hypothetical protein
MAMILLLLLVGIEGQSPAIRVGVGGGITIDVPAGQNGGCRDVTHLSPPSPTTAALTLHQPHLLFCFTSLWFHEGSIGDGAADAFPGSARQALAGCW